MGRGGFHLGVLWAALLLTGVLPGTAGAQTVTASDDAGLAISIPGAISHRGFDAPILTSSRPAVHIAIDLSQEPGAAGVACGVMPGNGGEVTYGPCGTRDPTCKVSQCWTWRPAISPDGDYRILAHSADASGNAVGYDAEADIAVDGVPPVIKMDHGSPCLLCGATAPGPHRVSVGFGWTLIDPGMPDSETIECQLTSGARPRIWRRCSTIEAFDIGSQEQTTMNLLRSSRPLRFWIRGVDALGLVGPVSELGPFASAPCRAHLRGSTLRGFLRHGLLVRFVCVQPISFYSRLLLSDREFEKLGAQDPSLDFRLSHSAQTRTRSTFGTQTVRLRPLPGLHARVKRTHPLSVVLAIYSADAAEIQRFSFKLR